MNFVGFVGFVGFVIWIGLLALLFANAYGCLVPANPFPYAIAIIALAWTGITFIVVGVDRK